MAAARIHHAPNARRSPDARARIHRAPNAPADAPSTPPPLRVWPAALHRGTPLPPPAAPASTARLRSASTDARHSTVSRRSPPASTAPPTPLSTPHPPRRPCASGRLRSTTGRPSRRPSPLRLLPGCGLHPPTLDARRSPDAHRPHPPRPQRPCRRRCAVEGESSIRSPGRHVDRDKKNSC
ncbi:WAS/WASL-interacting protein family member 3-like [Sorghum bicolor]|uniref:WAS/WASL-interacting protein family member 3-like n=1 Tax=Sorghum bicolor TaxID=4558 RepID=UPI000B425274|nr:WAS/WASL-interacting protein family member 3-like [Sorghum bicolor]|eukprot:XP_021304141.1 WAS/WASL-interacting protein family member 3-like [Sorghum bicolor]